MPFTKYDPDYVVAPAETVKEWFVLNPFEHKLYNGIDLVIDVINKKELTQRHALYLHELTDIPVQFWITLEHNYRVGLAAGKKDWDAS